VSSVEAVGDSKDRRQPLDPPTELLVQRAVVAVRFPGRRAAVVARHVRHDHLIGRRHAQEIGVQDEMIRMLVVPLVADVVSHVVE